MWRITYRHQDGSRTLESSLLVATKKQWARRPESRSPLWGAHFLGRWVLALGIDVLDTTTSDVDCRSTSQLSVPGRN